MKVEIKSYATDLRSLFGTNWWGKFNWAGHFPPLSVAERRGHFLKCGEGVKALYCGLNIYSFNGAETPMDEL